MRYAGSYDRGGTIIYQEILMNYYARDSAAAAHSAAAAADVRAYSTYVYMWASCVRTSYVRDVVRACVYLDRRIVG